MQRGLKYTQINVINVIDHGINVKGVKYQERRHKTMSRAIIPRIREDENISIKEYQRQHRKHC